MSEWRNDPVTEKQLEYIKNIQEFSVFPIPSFMGKTKGEASDYISRYAKMVHEGFDFASHGDNYGDRI